MKRICIIGGGAAALLLLVQLEKNNIDAKSITVIDPTHSGGDLNMKWLHVKSNTTWQQIIEAVPSRTSFAKPFCDLQANEIVELKYIIQYLRAVAKDYLNKTLLHTDTVVHVEHVDNTWKVFLKHRKIPICFDVVFFCQGSEPKSLDLPFPSIPLDIALDIHRLTDHVSQGQHVMVFGTAHSGPLIVKHLVELGVKVTLFYATEKPFYFERDGEYDGIKQEAATIAENLLNGLYPTVTLESFHDMSALIRASKSADSCIYACGFEPRIIDPEWKFYDGTTGRIQGTTTAWGFGIAYPNKAPDGIHWDVSVPAFQAHIEKQMPDILATLQ